MKIYNKKRFTAGILCALACFAGLCWGVQNNFQAGFGSLFGMGVFLIVGIRMALRSLSRGKRNGWRNGTNGICRIYGNPEVWPITRR